MSAKQIMTRFRAYQLGSAGSSLSYYADGHFTLIEARLTDQSRQSLDSELDSCSKSGIDTLHITSWDQDHCSAPDLEAIVRDYLPKKIEYPGYEPTTENGKKCLEQIKAYSKRDASRTCVRVDPDYIKGLSAAAGLGYNNILYWPRSLSSCSNDNSTVKLFRTGAFNVASLGDVEDDNIASYLRMCSILRRETDVLILAHHGADCATNSKNLFERIRPQIAICTSDFDNKFEHPRCEVKSRLFEIGIPIYTTKTGDVLVCSIAPHDNFYKVINFRAGTTEVSSQRTFSPKKSGLLAKNQDSLRNYYAPKKRF